MAYRLCEANLNGQLNDAKYLVELEKINARGEKLLTLELTLAQERSRKAEADAQKASADAQKSASEAAVDLKSIEALSDPAVDAATRDEGLRKLLSK